MYGMGPLLWKQAWRKAHGETTVNNTFALLERRMLQGHPHDVTSASALYYAEIDRRSRSNEFAMQLIRWYGVGARGVFANLKVTVGPT